MALFIAVDVDPELARDPAASRKLAEVCPVDIFKVSSGGALEDDRELIAAVHPLRP